MGDFLRQLRDQFKEVWGRLTRLQRVLVVGIPVVLFLTLFGFILWSVQPKEDVLFSRLAPQDAAEVIDELKRENISYRLEDAGRTILVPADRVYETRLSLAAKGLPKGGGVGFEIFDQTKFGMTDFTQKVNFKRALEGELQRTIASLSQIERARVHIVIPEPQLFTEEEKPTTASVVVELKPEKKLSREQVKGIVHLVASAVEGLKPENVTVVDAQSRILSAFLQEEAQDAAAEEGGIILSQQAKWTLQQLEVQRNFERDLEKKVSSMLAKVLGNNRFAVSVSAELNFDKNERESEIFEPVVDGKGVPRSEQSKREQFVGDGGFPTNIVGGVPGTDTNIPGYQALAGTSSQFSREENLVNYEVNRTVQRNVAAPGTPKRISVAVFVDDLQAHQVASIQTAVVAAAGLDLARGDQVAVENMPFDNSKALAALKESEMQTQQAFYFTLGKVLLLLLIGLGLLLFLWILIRPKKVKEYVEDVEALEVPEEPVAVPQVEDLITPEMTAEDLARMEAAREAKRREQLRKDVVELASRKPEDVARIIKKWLAEE